MAAKKKKRASKKKATTKRVTNRTELTLKVNKGSAVDGGQSGHIWHVTLKSSQGSVTAGTVLAKTETEAKKKAKRLLRTLIA